MRCPKCRADHPANSGERLYISAECPICLETTEPFVLLPCKHGVCAECYPRLEAIAAAAPSRAAAPTAPALPSSTGTGNENNVVLNESIDENWEPSDAEVREYAVWLGMDPATDEGLFYIAREGLKAPLPPPWKPCKTSEGEIFYFNFSTGVSEWDHPCDEFYRKQYEESKAARAAEQPCGVRTPRRAKKKKQKTLGEPEGRQGSLPPLRLRSLPPLGLPPALRGGPVALAP